MSALDTHLKSEQEKRAALLTALAKSMEKGW